ncbi:AraC family transcriptional regulator [Paenibacillus sp. YN15]|uniref:AraC family transcriptional regulator n=1 Tax=Paenibacillus sp. YN15 TaxID=1742774 RepID=UPI000DCDBA9A|nr:AraC family transcriptional regulator [Paenibacillus sp. YN15]RAU97307.1 AraC family transcriptional regulator [Paenibacillus sp. YN15]
MGKLFSKETTYYRQSLLLILIIATLPGLLLSGLMYWGAGGEIEEELHQLHQQKIHERAQTIDDTLSHLEMSLGHWAFEPQFDYLLNNKDFWKNYTQAWDITKTLLVIQSTSELIERVELYLAGTSNEGGIRFNPEHNMVEQPELNGQYMALLRQERTIFWTYPDSGYANNRDLALIQKVPGNSSEPIGFLMVRINMDKLAQLVETLTPYNGAKTLLVREDGGIIIGTGVTEKDELFVADMIRDIQAGSAEDGLYFSNWKGSKYSVTYDRFSELINHWGYISAAPIRSITTPLLSISKLIIIVSLIGLLLAVFLAWFASRRIYSPIGKLVRMLGGEKSGAPDKAIDEFSLINQRWQALNRENHSLQTKLKHELPHLKESFLQQLIQGYLYRYSAEELISRFSQYGGNVEQGIFTVVYLQLIGFDRLMDRFNKGDEGLVTFAACNIIEEITGGSLDQAYVINFHDLSIAVLIVERPAHQRDRIYGVCREVTQTINRILRMRATVVISPATDNITQVASVFEQAKSATRYRSFENENQILDMEQPGLFFETGSFNYPFAVERELIQALRAGEQEEAIRQLTLFVEAMSAEGMKEIDVQQGLMRLLAGILNAVSQVGVNPASLSQGGNMFEALSQIRDPQSIHQWFRENIVETYMRELEKRSNDQVKRMIEQAKQYLHEYYAKDISLESCADHVGATSHLLSKAFKYEVGINFTEYLTELRMDKAKTLLKESDIMINEIAFLVGYQPSYFIRLFKKLEGITPGRFREMVRGQGS